MDSMNMGGVKTMPPQYNYASKLIHPEEMKAVYWTALPTLTHLTVFRMPETDV